MSNKIYSECQEKVKEFFSINPKGWVQRCDGITKDGHWCVIVSGHYPEDDVIKNVVLFEIEGTKKSTLHETAIKIVQSAIIV